MPFLQIALRTKPNLVLIGEEVQASNMSLADGNVAASSHDTLLLLCCV